MTKSNILLIRHAEKPDKCLHETGIDNHGRDDPYSLSKKGWQRAKGLVGLFTDEEDRLPVPDRIFASAFRPDGGHSRRPEQTALPLSETLHCPIDLTWALHQEKELSVVLSGLKGTSLVCWQHQGLADLAKAVLVTQWFSALQEWPPNCYDMIWRISRSGSETRWSFVSYHMTDDGRLQLHADETGRPPL
ncbi:hypothetical protein [Acetobacter fallax]|uniref:Phosphoglycerate mutase n=1 Tax=Acetobacter fallax TaxID=1737473 RepID=A0ABX0KD64_9PROT|nr:hypothetical protein [Acetobacter fallax]NHO33935.1 hypothetical protein [Acetobacter fallax]NHO37840.1 hypothetical protein [Acetobacter fallax]